MKNIAFAFGVWAAVCAAPAASIGETRFAPRGTDDRTAEVLAAVKSGATLRFEKGEYHFRSPSKIEYSISNHDNPGSHSVFLPVTNVVDFSISGDGARFVFHGDGVGMTLMDSRRVSVKGVSFEWARPAFSEARVAKTAKDGVVLRFDRSIFPMSIERGKLFATGGGRKIQARLVSFFDGKTMQPIIGRRQIARADPQKGGGVRLTFSAKDRRSVREPRVGDIAVVRSWVRESPAISLYRSDDVLLEDCVVHSAEGMGVIAQRCENVTLRGSGAAADRTAGSFARKGSGIATSLQVDATHFSNCKGLVLVENCFFEGMDDDAINVHSTCLQIEEVVKPCSLVCRYRHRQSTGFEVFRPGETLRFIKADMLEPGAEAKVVSATMTSPDRVEITLDSPVPGKYGKGDAVENADWQPSVVFRNNIVRNVIPRGVLLTTTGKCLVEGNVFDGVSSQVIQLEGDASGWFESGACRDVTIRGNVFKDCAFLGGDGIVQIRPSVKDLKAMKERYHRNITVENNRFENCGALLLYARSASNILWRANETVPGTRKPRGKGIFDIEDCDDVETFSILILGHSFGMDSTEYLPALLAAAGIRSVRVGRFTKANCSLEERWNFIQTGARKSRDGKTNEYYESAPGSAKWVRCDKPEKQVFAERAWDCVILQDSLDNEGRYEIIRPWLDKVAGFIREDAKKRFGREPEICWNLFWPMSRLVKNSKNPILRARMALYGNDPQKMWEAYSAAARRIAADTGITNIVPTGATIMRLRATPLNTPKAREFTIDGYHLSRPVGRYAAACALFAHFITPRYGVGIVGNPLRVPDPKDPVTDANAAILQKCAFKAEADAGKPEEK